MCKLPTYCSKECQKNGGYQSHKEKCWSTFQHNIQEELSVQIGGKEFRHMILNSMIYWLPLSGSDTNDASALLAHKLKQSEYMLIGQYSPNRSHHHRSSRHQDYEDSISSPSLSFEWAWNLPIDYLSGIVRIKKGHHKRIPYKFNDKVTRNATSIKEIDSELAAVSVALNAPIVDLDLPPYSNGIKYVFAVWNTRSYESDGDGKSDKMIQSMLGSPDCNSIIKDNNPNHQEMQIGDSLELDNGMKVMLNRIPLSLTKTKPKAKPPVKKTVTPVMVSKLVDDININVESTSQLVNCKYPKDRKDRKRTYDRSNESSSSSSSSNSSCNSSSDNLIEEARSHRLKEMEAKKVQYQELISADSSSRCEVSTLDQSDQNQDPNPLQLLPTDDPTDDESGLGSLESLESLRLESHSQDHLSESKLMLDTQEDREDRKIAAEIRKPYIDLSNHSGRVTKHVRRKIKSKDRKNFQQLKRVIRHKLEGQVKDQTQKIDMKCEKEQDDCKHLFKHVVSGSSNLSADLIDKFIYLDASFYPLSIFFFSI